MPPAIEPVPPYLNFAPLRNAFETLTKASDRYRKAWTKASERSGEALGRAQLDAVNRKLMLAERALMDAQGLPGRPWFKHQLYAPGFYTGYGVKTIPAVREAIEQKQWPLAETSIASVAKVLEAEAGAIDAIAAELERAIR